MTVSCTNDVSMLQRYIL